METQTPSLFSSDNLKYVEINNLQPSVNQNKFANVLANAQNILHKLEESIEKSSKYETQLIKCKRYHTHSHDSNDWWEFDLSHDNDYKDMNTGKKTTGDHSGLTEYWSAMFIICLQHKYDQLSKRYKTLQEAYDKRCETISNRDIALLKMRHRVKRTYSKLMNAHKTLLTIGEKYLQLRCKMIEQKRIYEENIIRIQCKLNEAVETAEQARVEFDAQLARCLAEEHDSDTALLLYEIKKCNQLFLENLRLRTQIEESPSENVSWI